jgi:membrane-associated phospholipid phosphatase
LALLLLACAPLNGWVTMVAKGLAGRPRPATALVHIGETSFPSGHALEAMATVLALLTLLLPLLTTPWKRVVAVALGGLAVFTVGVARVALNVHHPSDVVAGWALGYVYFILCLWVFRPRPAARPATQPAARPATQSVSRPRDPTGS